MARRLLYVASAIAVTGFVATSIVRCDFPVIAFNSFSYIPNERPRLFVSHHPLRALPGQPVTIRLTPDLRPEDGAVQTAKAGLRRVSTNVRSEIDCPPVGATFECSFNLAASADDYIYDGRLVLANTSQVKALTTYRFRASATIGADEVLTLREPVKPVEALAASYRIDTVWVRDAGDGFTFNAFLTDVETGVYNGILADPVYRWRDQQLGFYVYGSPGLTTSYFSGLDTRCGQNPWPSEIGLRAALSDMEVIAVVHRHPTSASGIEGTVVAQSPSVFRDCAGNAVKSAVRGTFSVTGGIAQTARIAKHEFGHAAFGLGDEYTETTATRNVVPASLPPPITSGCCCVATTDSGGPSGPTGDRGGPGGPGLPGASVMFCVQPGGGISTAPGGLSPGIPACATSPPSFPASCGAGAQGGCSPLAGVCVQARMWLGSLPSGSPDTTRPNVYPSQAACEAGRARAVLHPGVEDRDLSLGTCRELCGPTTAPCPCEAEAWIVDADPANPAAPGAGAPDAMASVAAARDGGTCAWCVQTSLCVRWQRAIGKTADEAWSACDAPPIDAAATEHGAMALAKALLEWLAQIFKNVKFFS